MIFDCHTHMPSPTWDSRASWFGSVADAVQYLRDAGTDAALFNTFQGVFSETAADVREGNADALRLAREFDGFLYPGAVIHPSFPEASREGLERFRDEGYLWVGEIIIAKEPNCLYMDAPFLSLIEQCAKHGHAIQLHGHEQILDVARRFPEMQVVFSHITANLCPEMAALPNAWQDISGKCGGLTMGGLERAYDALGADRLLYGTDFTGYEPRCFMGRVDVVVPEAERGAVYSGNLIGLLDLIGSRPIR